MHTVFSFLDPLHAFIILLQRYMPSEPCYGQLTAVKVSAGRCHLPVSFNKLYADQLLVLLIAGSVP